MNRLDSANRAFSHHQSPLSRNSSPASSQKRTDTSSCCSIASVVIKTTHQRNDQTVGLIHVRHARIDRRNVLERDRTVHSLSLVLVPNEFRFVKLQKLPCPLLPKCTLRSQNRSGNPPASQNNRSSVVCSS